MTPPEPDQSRGSSLWVPYVTLLRGFGVFSDPIGLEKELYTTPHPDYQRPVPGVAAEPRCLRPRAAGRISLTSVASSAKRSELRCTLDNRLLCYIMEIETELISIVDSFDPLNVDLLLSLIKHHAVELLSTTLACWHRSLTHTSTAPVRTANSPPKPQLLPSVLGGLPCLTDASQRTQVPGSRPPVAIACPSSRISARDLSGPYSSSEAQVRSIH